MCGRYVVPNESAIRATWPGNTLDSYPVQEYYNMVQTLQVPVILQNTPGHYRMQSARWGFIPVWWTEPKPPQHTFNARAEDIFQKPMWKTPIKKYRCLLPMQGWYEWPEKNSVDENTGEIFLKGQPYFLHVTEQPVIFAAGIFNVLGREGEPETYTCSMLTTEAAESIKAMHHRMVVVMGKDQLSHWLDPSLGINDIQHLMDNSVKEFSHYTVDPRVNSTRLNDPSLMQKMQVNSLF